MLEKQHSALCMVFLPFSVLKFRWCYLEKFAYCLDLKCASFITTKRTHTCSRIDLLYFAVPVMTICMIYKESSGGNIRNFFHDYPNCGTTDPSSLPRFSMYTLVWLVETAELAFPPHCLLLTLIMLLPCERGQFESTDPTGLGLVPEMHFNVNSVLVTNQTCTKIAIDNICICR